MDAAHLHLVINHVPVIGTAFALLVLLYGWLRKNEEVQRAGFGAFILTALLTIPAYYSGEFSEDVIERLPGVSHDLIDSHEALARPAYFAMLFAGAVALGLLVWYWRKGLPRWAGLVVIVLALGVAGLMGRVANLGGQIRHQEIRAGFTAPAESDEREAEEEAKENDDGEGGHGRGRGRGRGGEQR